MIRATYLLVLMFLLSAGTAAPEEKKDPPLFRLGMTQTEMFAAFGEPESYLNVRTQGHLSRKEFITISGRCMCRPLYNRKTKANEYEIVVFERGDESASRLHPTIRIEEVRFRLDRNMTEEQAAADIDEIRMECNGQCALLPPRHVGERRIGRGGSNVQFIFHYGDNRSLTDISMAPVAPN